MTIQYRTDMKIQVEQYISICQRAGLKRPQDPERVKRMIDHAHLSLTAWDGDTLVGYARGLTDFAFDCYLSDLAVDQEYQQRGIGKNLLQHLQNLLGEEVMILLLASKAALEYYPKVGFTEASGGYWIPNQK